MTSTRFGGIGSFHAASNSGTSAIVLPSKSRSFSSHSRSLFSLHLGQEACRVISAIVSSKECPSGQTHQAFFLDFDFADSQKAWSLRSWSHQETASFAEFFNRFAPLALLVPAVAVFEFRVQVQPHPMSPRRSAEMRPQCLHFTAYGSPTRLGLVSEPRNSYPCSSATFLTTLRSSGFPF